MGGGVVKLLLRNPDKYRRTLGAPLELAGVADRSLKPDDVPGLSAKLITRDAAALVVRPDIDIVVELFGGHEPARALIMKALAAGKDVVTGNKALLAEYGGQIFREAGRHGLAVGFEASVGGGVPIIRTLREALAGDRQRAVYGIVNGTCNSILTTMTEGGVEFSAALADAQAKGLAEANPATDVEGRVSLGETGRLRVLQSRREFGPVVGHRGEDRVAGAVDDPINGALAIAGERLA